MTHSFIYNVTILDKKYSLREISFLEYRNLVKNLMSDDPGILKNVFESLLDSIILNKNDVNIQHKFLLLLKYRELIHGKLLEFSIGDAKINYSLDDIFHFFNRKVNSYFYELDGNIFYFNLPSTFITEDNVIDNTIDCFESVNGERGKVLDDLPAIPFHEIYRGILTQFSDFKFKIKYLDYDVSLLDLSCLYFIKSIFLYDLQNFYDLEYSLRRNLNFTVQDFSVLSFPECNMMIKQFLKEVAEKEKESKQVDSIE